MGVTVTLEAETREDLDAKIESVKQAYHPAGYGTYVQSEGLREDGTYWAVVWRASSCD